MSEIKAGQSLQNLGNALQRLKEALDEKTPHSLVVDATIQRFEFVIELYWKTFKRLLALEGIITSTPRESLQRAYQAGWIHEEQLWLQMLRDRNETSHVYDEATANRIYTRIGQYFPEMQRTYKFLAEKFGENKDGRP